MAGKKSRCLLWGLELMFGSIDEELERCRVYKGKLCTGLVELFFHWAEFSSCKHQVRADIGEEADLVSTVTHTVGKPLAFAGKLSSPKTSTKTDTIKEVGLPFSSFSGTPITRLSFFALTYFPCHSHGLVGVYFLVFS